jgi:hypothetical protein
VDAFAPPAEPSGLARPVGPAPREVVPALMETLRLYGALAHVLIPLSLIVKGPLAALQVAVPRGGAPGANVLHTVAELFGDTLLAAAVLVALDRHSRGARTYVIGALRDAIRRWGPLVSVWLWTGILTGLATCLFVLPGLWLALHYALIAPVVVLERRSQERCWELVASRRGFVAGVLLPIGLGGMVVSVAVALAIGAVAKATDLTALADAALVLCYAPLWPVLTVGQYVVWRALVEPVEAG